MNRTTALRYSVCGCLFLVWTGTALAEDGVAPTVSTATAATATALADTGPEPGAPAAAMLINTTSQPAVTTTEPAVPAAAVDACAVSDACIDQYLWSLYERTPKLDTIKVSERRKATVKRKGKTRTVMTTVTRLVDEDFTWKDFKAAEKAGLRPMDYVIGGMDRDFKRTLYRALRTMDEAGLMPGITSAFRDDFRQGIATGNKAQTDRSYHGGSTRGGYGHGLAVDLVSVKGATRAERYRSSQELWAWVDAHGKEVGVGRPYLDRDAPHVAPIDGKEYAAHRGVGTTHVAAAGKHRRAARAVVTKLRRAVTVAKADAARARVHHISATAKARVRKSAT